MVLTAITVYAENRDDPYTRIHGVSTDGKLDPEFWKTEPQKCAWVTSNYFIWDLFLDLPVGKEITVIYGNDADPSYPWYGTIRINDNDPTYGARVAGEVYKGHFLSLTFTVPDRPVYPVKLAFLKDQCFMNMLSGEEMPPPHFAHPCMLVYSGLNICCSSAKTYCTNWDGNAVEVSYWDKAKFSLQPGHLLTAWVAIKPYVHDPLETSFPGGMRSKLWWSISDPRLGPSTIKRRPIFFLWPSETVLPAGNAIVDQEGKPLVVWGLRVNGLHPDLYVALCKGGLVDGDTILVIGGHYDPFTKEPVIDDQVAIPVYYDASCTPETMGGGLQITDVEVSYSVPFDLRPGRIAYVKVYYFNPTDYAVYPYVKILDPDGNVIRTYHWEQMLSGWAQRADVAFALNQSMINQGYFKIEVGHLRIPSTSTTVLEYPVEVADDSRIINLQAAAVAARINSLSYSTYTPQVAAKINSIAYSTYAPPVAAKINSVAYSTYTPPTPPPPQYASLSGKVLSLIGPVANAQVSLNGMTDMTKADGSYTIRNIPPKYGYTLRVDPTSLLHKVMLSPRSEKIDLPLPTSYTKNVTLPLNPIGLGASSAALIALIALIYKAAT